MTAGGTASSEIKPVSAEEIYFLKWKIRQKNSLDWSEHEVSAAGDLACHSRNCIWAKTGTDRNQFDRLRDAYRWLMWFDRLRDA